jgi:hypothetical protein
VAGDYEKARKGGFFMRSTGTDAAVVEQAYFIPGSKLLGAGYEKAAGPHWVARRHPGGRISWRLRPPEPELAG